MFLWEIPLMTVERSSKYVKSRMYVLQNSSNDNPHHWATEHPQRTAPVWSDKRKTTTVSTSNISTSLIRCTDSSKNIINNTVQRHETEDKIDAFLL